MFKQTVLTVCVLLCMQYVHAQSFWIDAKDKYSINQFSEKLIALGFSITDSTGYDYRLTFHVKQTSKFNSMYKGHIVITDKTGNKIGESKPLSRGAVPANGFNASYHIAKIIARDYLEKLTAELKK